MRIGASKMAWGCALLLAVVVVAARPGSFFATDLQEYSGDLSANALLLNDASHLRALTGPYSRFGFNHPGPLAFYALAATEMPLRWIATPFGRARLAQLILTAAFLGLAMREATRLRGWPGDGPLLLLGYLLAVLPIVTGGMDPLCDPWGPLMVLAPFCLVTVAAANLASGDGRGLPGALLGAAVCVESHAGLVLPVGLLALFGATGWRGQRPPRLRGITCAAILVAALLPIAVDLALGLTGNPGRLFEFATTSREGNTLGDSFAALGWSWTHPAFTLLSSLFGGWSPYDAGPRVVILAALLLVSGVGAWRGGPRIRRLVVAALLGLLAALAFAATSPGDLPAQLYLFHFANVSVGALVFAGLTRTRRAIAAATAAALALIFVIGLAPPPQRPPVDYEKVVRTLDLVPGEAVWLRLERGGPDHDLWPHMIGLAAVADHLGVDVRLDSCWREMCGPWRIRPAEFTGRGFLIAAAADDAGPFGSPRAMAGNLVVYGFAPEHWGDRDMVRGAALLGRPRLKLGEGATPTHPSLAFLGFSGIESSWRWSEGNASEIVFRLDTGSCAADSLVLAVDVGTLDAQQVSISIADHPVRSERLTGFGPFSWRVTFPTNWLTEDQEVQLQFACPDAHCPGTTDHRVLGVAVQRLQVDRL